MKSGEEVDFVITYAGRPSNVIEVTYRLDNSHLSRVADAVNELNLKNALVITWDEEGKELVKGVTIEVKPLWKWLLHQE